MCIKATALHRGTMQCIAGWQVPKSLVVCYINSNKQLAAMTQNVKWSSSIYLGAASTVVNWELQKGQRTRSSQIDYKTM